MMELKKRKKIVVMGLVILFMGTTLIPGIYAHRTDLSNTLWAHKRVTQPQVVSDEQYKITCHISTKLGPILTRSLILSDEETYEDIQMAMENLARTAASYSGNAKLWLQTLDEDTNALLTKLEDVGLIKNERDKEMIKSQILGGRDSLLEDLWEQSIQTNETLNNSLCLMVGYGTERTRMDYTLRSPFLLSMARIFLQVLEFALKYDFTIASQILNYLSTQHVLNLALYSKYYVNETRVLPPPWVGVFTYGLNEYQEVKGNCETTIIGYAGIVMEFYIGIGNIFSIDSTGIAGFAGYATMTPTT